MFQVKQFEVCPTGITTFTIEFDLGRGMVKDHGSFLQKSDADRYILSSKKSYILLIYEKYINLIRNGIESGHKDFYCTDAKVASFERADKYTYWFQDKDLKTICKVILAIQEDLRKLLPGSGNPSLENLEGKLIDMIVFSKHELEITQRA